MEQRVEYSLTLDELIALRFFEMSQSPPMRTRNFYVWLAFSVVLGAGLSCLVFAEAVPFPLWSKIVFVSVCWLLVLCVIVIDWFARQIETYRLKRLQRNPRKRQAAAQQLPPKISLLITADSITYASDKESEETPWAKVTKVAVTDDHVFVRLPGRRVIVVPKRAFENESAFSDFVTAIKDHHQRHRASLLSQAAGACGADETESRSQPVRCRQRRWPAIVYPVFGPLMAVVMIVAEATIFVSMKGLARIGAGIAMLAGAGMFAYDMAERFAWVELDGCVMRAKQFWTRRVIEHPINEIMRIRPGIIEFQHGTRIVLHEREMIDVDRFMETLKERLGDRWEELAAGYGTT